MLIDKKKFSLTTNNLEKKKTIYEIPTSNIQRPFLKKKKKEGLLKR